MPKVCDPPSTRSWLRKTRVITAAPWVLVLALGLGGIGYATFRALVGAPPWQYVYLQWQKRRATIPSAYEPLTWAEFLALPELPKAYGVADWDTIWTYSARGVSLDGYIAEILHRPDGDLHVHLRSTPSPHCFPKGHREEQIVTEVSPNFQPRATGWSYAVLRDLCDHQRRVRIAGWLMHDFPHRESHTWRATPWEIHPVTRIEVWDEDQHAWQLVP